MPATGNSVDESTRTRARSVTLRRVSGSLLLLGLGVAVLLAGRPLESRGPRRSDPTQPQALPAKARVRFQVLGTLRDSGTGLRRVESYGNLAAGDSLTRYAATDETAAASLCDAAFIADPASVEAAFVWQLNAVALGVSPTGTTLDLSWTRFRGNPTAGRIEAGDRRTITLGPGDYHVFDYVGAAAGDSTCANVMLRVLADPLPPPEAQPAITVDLWLSQDGSAGRRFTHRRIAGTAGELLPFRLDPLRWSPAGAVLPVTGPAPAISLEVNGTVQVMLRPDGFLDASVRLFRGLSWGSSRVRGEGQQDFRCALEEPVAILLPDPGGRASMPLVDALRPPFAAGITTEGSSTVVDFARFFAGTQGAVYIVIHRQK